MSCERAKTVDTASLSPITTVTKRSKKCVTVSKCIKMCSHTDVAVVEILKWLQMLKATTRLLRVLIRCKKMTINRPIYFFVGVWWGKFSIYLIHLNTFCNGCLCLMWMKSSCFHINTLAVHRLNSYILFPLSLKL